MITAKRIKNFFCRHFSILTHDVSPLLMKHIDSSKFLPKERLLRLGTLYGGWTIPVADILSSESVCYLAGAGEDISFDCQLASKFKCTVKVIDPTPRAMVHFYELQRAIAEGRKYPINNSKKEHYTISSFDFLKISFLPVGLADRDVKLKFYMPKNPEHVSCSIENLQKTKEYFSAQCYKLSTIMKREGHERVDLIKLDIEGSEYAVINNILSENLLPKILLIEFDAAHSDLSENAQEELSEVILALYKYGMVCVAAEGKTLTFISSIEYARIKDCSLVNH